ncbi:MAG: hypothetical protein JSS89_06010 [Bacteroidetes bacterium]|nr:hypothetical protein [Bacteroidota bacterium]
MKQVFTIATNALRIFAVVFSCACVTALTSGCRETVHTPAEVMQWVLGPEHGLTDSVDMKRYVIRATYMPVSVRAARTARSAVGQKAAEANSEQIMFAISVIPKDRSSSVDVLFDDARNLDDFTVRLRDIALRLHECVTLVVDGNERACAGSFTEQTIGLARMRTIYVVFPISEEEFERSTSSMLKWRDHTFGAGIAAFAFTPKRISDIPVLAL